MQESMQESIECKVLSRPIFIFPWIVIVLTFIFAGAVLVEPFAMFGFSLVLPAYVIGFFFVIMGMRSLKDEGVLVKETNQRKVNFFLFLYLWPILFMVAFMVISCVVELFKCHISNISYSCEALKRIGLK